MAGKKLRLFVYGTLRKGGVAAHFLQRFPLIVPDATLTGLSLYDAGWYPYAVPAPESCSVKGDIFEIPESSLPGLDEYEGPEYKRVFLEKYQVLIYLKINSVTTGLPKVENGDWLTYWRKKNTPA